MHKRHTSGMNGDDKRSTIITLLIRDGLACHWCHEPFTATDRRPTIDHLVSRLAGGTDEQSNLVLADERCNQLRSNPPLGRRRTKADGVVIALPKPQVMESNRTP